MGCSFERRRTSRLPSAFQATTRAAPGVSASGARACDSGSRRYPQYVMTGATTDERPSSAAKVAEPASAEARRYRLRLGCAGQCVFGRRFTTLAIERAAGASCRARSAACTASRAPANADARRASRFWTGWRRSIPARREPRPPGRRTRGGPRDPRRSRTSGRAGPIQTLEEFGENGSDQTPREGCCPGSDGPRKPGSSPAPNRAQALRHRLSA